MGSARANASPSVLVAPALISLAAVACVALPALVKLPSVAAAPMWFVAVCVSLWGYGAILARRVLPETVMVGTGLRMCWGASALLAMAGVLLTVSALRASVMLMLVALGLLLAVADLWSVEGRRRLDTSVRTALRFCRSSPLSACACVLVAALIAFHLVGAIADRYAHPFDDDVGYLPMVRRLWDIGNLHEPFSFRRISAYGGQVVLLAVFSLKTAVRQVHLFDRGFCVLALALLIYERRGLYRLSLMKRHLLALFFLLLPDVSINTASYYSGAAFLFAMYVAVERDAFAALPSWRRALLVGPLVAAVCTFRQNYLPVAFGAVVFEACLASAAVSRGPGRLGRVGQVARDRAPTVGVALAFLVPFALVSHTDVGTFLFPLQGGAFNPAMEVRDQALTLAAGFRQQLWLLVQQQPFVCVPLVLLVAFGLRLDLGRARDRARLSLIVASAIAFVLLVRSFTQSSSPFLNRYTFGFVLPMTLAVFASALSQAKGRATVPFLLSLIAIVAQIVLETPSFYPRIQKITQDFEEVATDATGLPTRTPEGSFYEELQEAIPAGETVALTVDEPFYLDFRRNKLINLDMPGYMSVAPGWPFFQSPESVRQYLTKQGIHYLAFMEHDFSRYQYRYDDWVAKLLDEQELWRICSAYEVDVLGTWRELAAHQHVVYRDHGLVVVDLRLDDGQLPTAPPAWAASPEPDRREQFVAWLAQRDGFQEAAGLVSTSERRLEEGFSKIEYDPPFDIHNHAFRWVAQRAHVRLRRHGEQPMHLLVAGWADVKYLRSRPTLTVTINGHVVSFGPALADGGIGADVRVNPSVLEDREWSDMYLTFSTVGYADKLGPENQLILLTDLRWRAE